MRDTIYTIPLTDVFSPREGCPVCRLRSMLEKRCVEYIMGAAMMEPDIRIETNRYGFCPSHLELLIRQKNRLSLALMLETHLDELRDRHMPPSVKKGTPPVSETCFVCREIDGAAEKLLDTALKLFFSDSSFQALFLEQDYCWKHYEALCLQAGAALNRRQSAQLAAALTERQKARLSTLREDVHSFTTSFDYRNAGAANRDEQIKTAVERAVDYLK